LTVKHILIYLMMKNLAIYIFSITILFSCTDKNDAIKSGYESFYEIHGNDKNVLTFGMPKFIFKMFVNIPDKEIEEAVDNIETIDIMYITKPEKSLVTELYNYFPVKYYKPVLSLNENEMHIRFLGKQRRKKIDELIMIAELKNENSCTLMRIGGSFNLKTIERFTNGLNVKDLIKYR